MYKVIMITEKYIYYSNSEEDVKMYEKESKKLVAKHMLAINNMLFELELTRDEEITCEYIDEGEINKFIMQYW